MSKYYYYQTTYGLHIYQPFMANNSETGVFNLFNETHGKKYVFWPFKAARVKMSIMKIRWFKQYWCLITILKNNNNKRTQLDTNPRLTLAQTLTLSTGDVVLTILLVGVVTSLWYLLSGTLMHHKNSLRDLGSNQISISCNWTPVREIDAQTEKITELPPHGIPPRPRRFFKYLLHVVHWYIIKQI